MRDENFPQHFRGYFADVLRRFANLHAAFESVFECALAAPTGVNLRFDDHLNVAQFACDLLRFIERRCHSAPRRRYVELLQ